MAEPLNDFLETLETLDSDPYMSDEEFGQRVRIAWEECKQREIGAGASTHDAHDYKGDPIRVTIPERG